MFIDDFVIHIIFIDFDTTYLTKLKKKKRKEIIKSDTFNLIWIE